MNYSPKIYAKALVDLTLGALSEKEKEKMTKGLILAAKKNNDAAKLKKIAALAEKYLLRKSGGRKIVLEIPRPDSRPREALKDFLSSFDIVEEKINPELVAGLRLTVNDEKQLDCSLAEKLNKMFH